MKELTAPSNTLTSLRRLMDEVCRQILEYRECVPIVPELCLPTAATEESLKPIIMQVAYNLSQRDKPVSWPVAEITAIRGSKGTKGRIFIGLFNKAHLTLVECKSVRSSAASYKDSKISIVFESAKSQLQDIDLKTLLFCHSPNETISNIRTKNKLIVLVAINITCKTSVTEKSQCFARKVESIQRSYGLAMIVSVEYEPHIIRVSNDMGLEVDEREKVSIGHVFILEEVFRR